MYENESNSSSVSSNWPVIVKWFWSHHGLVLTKPEKIGNSQNIISNDDEKNNSVTPVAENNQ